MDLNSYGEKPYQIRTLARDSSHQGGLSGAVLACSGLRGSAIIIHGSPGCGWAGRWGEEKWLRLWKRDSVSPENRDSDHLNEDSARNGR